MEALLKDLQNPTKQVYLHGNVTETSINSVIKEILEIRANDVKLIGLLAGNGSTVAKKQITLHVSTYGGNMIEMFGLYDILKYHEVNTITYGKVMSAGIPIFLAGKFRSCYPNTIFMIHEPSNIFWGKLAEVESRLEFSHSLANKMYDILFAETKITKAQLQSYFEKKEDWIFDAKTAKRLGIVHHIIE